MSETITRLSQIPWLVKWAGDVRSALGPGFTIDVDGGLEIGGDATEEDMKAAAASLLASRTRSSQIIRVVDRFLGNLINHHSIINKITWKESIEALGLCESDGRSMRSLARLPRIVTRLDAETLMLPDLTTKHFDQATAFQPPELTHRKKEWDDKVKQILIEASLDPTERGTAWVTEKMKALQVEMGIDTGRKESSGDILKKIAQLSYILNKWSEEDFKDSGDGRGVFIDHYEALIDEAVVRCMFDCPSDSSAFIPFWRTIKEPTENDSGTNG